MKFEEGDHISVIKEIICFEKQQLIGKVGFITDISEDTMLINFDESCPTCSRNTKCNWPEVYWDEYLFKGDYHNRNGANS